MSLPSPSFVLETALYASDLEAAERFYGGILGLEVLFREEGRHVFFRCGPGVLLLFRAEVTRQGNTVPPHGAEGSGHVAFAVASDRLEEWQDYLTDHGIEIEHDQDWGDRDRSLYVRDPAGNSVELATPTLWDTATRDDWLRLIRPQHDPKSEAANPVEQFHHETLRPLIEVLTPTILRIVAERLDQQDDGFSTLTEDARQDRLRALLEEDEALQQTLYGTLIGHFTEEELSAYLTHREALRQRILAQMLARLQEHTGAIAAHISM